MARKKKVKRFRAVQAVKELARERIGAPPARRWFHTKTGSRRNTNLRWETCWTRRSNRELAPRTPLFRDLPQLNLAVTVTIVSPWRRMVQVPVPVHPPPLQPPNTEGATGVAVRMTVVLVGKLVTH